MPRLQCPVCRIVLGEEETHCPRCGLRIAALPPRRRQRGPEVTTARWGRLAAEGSRVWSAMRGLVAGLVIAVASAVAAVPLARGHGGYVVVLSNIAGVAGMVVVGIAVALGGVRVSRWSGGDIEAIRERTRGRGGHAPTATRIAVGLAGLPPLLLAIVLLALR